MSDAPDLVLLDNGSLEPAATRSLRRIAADLAGRLGRPVFPVSLLHSHKIPAEQLDGVAADILEPWLKRALAAGRTRFLVLPLFFGPSGALVDYLPARLAHLRQTWPGLELTLAPCLCDAAEGGDSVILGILADQVRATPGGLTAGSTQVLLVDHGSPKREVTVVRDRLAASLAAELGGSVAAVTPASMERRPEPEYDFNEPLLERALPALPEGCTDVVVSLLFVSPGRHAGPGGDIATICEAARVARPGLQVRMTALVGEHPGLVALLARRAAAAGQAL